MFGFLGRVFSAREAYYRTKYSPSVEALLKQIFETITDEIEHCHIECNFRINRDVYNQDAIKTALKVLRYLEYDISFDSNDNIACAVRIGWSK